MTKMEVESELDAKLRKFCEINAEFRQEFETLVDQESSIDLIYKKLGRHLLNPDHTEKIVDSFRSDFLKILSLAFDQDKTEDYSQAVNVSNAVVLAKLIDLHPDSHNFILKYFETSSSPFEQSTGTPTLPKRRKLSKPRSFDNLTIAHACYRLLTFKPDFFKSKWNWSQFFEQFCKDPDPKVRWLYARCLAVYTGMNESASNTYLKYVLTADEITECDLHFALSTSERKHADFNESSNESKSIVAYQNVVCVNGIYLPVFGKEIGSCKLIEVESTMRNLRKVALGVATNKAVSLLGPVGSGKTSLVEFLADKTGRIVGESFVKVQLGDQTDSKMLLGTYRCTDVPGEFVWQPGVLTQAVLDGSWLLLEDIDSASMDIACVLSGLIENNYLTVPGYRDHVPITPGFQLFVTQRLITTISGHHKKHSSANTLLEKHVLNINIEPIKPDELNIIITTLHPALKTICTRMVDVFLLFTRDVERLPRNNRLISTRDLFKWCSRAVIDFDVSSQASALKVLQDAIDIFCCSYSDLTERLNLAKEISTHLGIINEKARFFCEQYKPNLSLANNRLSVGRATMDCKETFSNKTVKFCFTRPSSCLLERIMSCVIHSEPVLLVGETGTGKTYSVQYLASVLGQKLTVINMNQQSDSADLLGGFKPVDLKFVIAPLKQRFEDVFMSFFNVESNKKFLQNINYCFNESQWGMLVKLMNKSCEAAMNRLSTQTDKSIYNNWNEIAIKLQKLETQLKHKNALAFAFIEGSLVKAVENGHWVLLDEINLANAETLECLSGLLEGSNGTLSLLERGDKKPVQRHNNFTLFSCMNPSTDVGKKDLPAGLRNRFTEFFVDELIDKNDLFVLVGSYLEAMSLNPEKLERIVKFYLNVRKEAVMSLSDGLGHKPHFSLRSLCRALTIASKNPCGMFNRSLYEAFCLSFLTQLDAASYKMVEAMIAKYMIGSPQEVKAVLKQPIMEPKTSKAHLQFEGYWILKGELEPIVVDDYILTESVRRNLRDLVRVVSIGKLPVLLQGETSVGKTSLITFLAKSSGYKCVRINNHEHTDLQEYIGSYVANSEGKLQFREGLLVQAMRQGHWIILDELNLAPTDVLEALNRVLDDNRELFIPETHETVKAHPNFMLFATQNPPGAYGGRKMLSRAFRNRFVELHFNEIPHDELEFILHKRCQMAPSYAKKMVNVMKDLQTRRRGSAAFAGKHGFITLRDLFRWGERYRLAQNISTLYDWDQHLADEGFLLLAGRVRKSQEREEIVSVIQKHMKRSVSPENLFSLSDKTSSVTKEILEKIYANKSKHKNIVWTYNMRQLAVLVCKALQFKEPVLLVGETGGGKTTVCNLIAENNGQRLVTVNCHMHTESGDFLGGLRPVRDHSEDINKLFEWVDGPLVQAMQAGNLFLADEISLADDSVLERINSLLEPERTLLLAEKDNVELIAAHTNFYFVGTMNPGGDFGKKELSPALRNRFTEIWCDSCTNRQDLIDIIEHNCTANNIGVNIMDFIEWFKLQEIGKRFTISIRDILTWVTFINVCMKKVGVANAYLHGACLTFLDSLGSGVTSTENNKALKTFRDECVTFIRKQCNADVLDETLQVQRTHDKFGINPFYIEFGGAPGEKYEFTFNAPTTVYNALRLLRGLQLNKAILLEGSPGVGKTSLVTALAKATRNKIFRINLSDQTDISDLFGADLPVEDGQAGQFAWRDGPLLQALKQGHWILLDELNLASQSVLEGLNACLDHRGEIFIPELGKTFYVKPGTKFFGCQNPLKQGGSRRGLPQSFLNRFTQVHLTSLDDKDLAHILQSQFTKIPEQILQKMIDFNTELNRELDLHTFGHKGSPWEFNLRDLTRWCEATIYHEQHNESYGPNEKYHPENILKLIYVDRMRSAEDKRRIEEIFKRVFGVETAGNAPVCYVTEKRAILGDVEVEREEMVCNESVLKQEDGCLVLRQQFQVLRSLAYCVNLNWMSILVGSAGSGKSSAVRTLAKLMGRTLRTLSVTSAMDTTDILGGFEQADYTRHLEELVRNTEKFLLEILQKFFIGGQQSLGCKYMECWEKFQKNLRTDTKSSTMLEETKKFLIKVEDLTNILQNLLEENFIEDDMKEKVRTLQDTATNITIKVQRENSMNAGGKFEWVDSILIKCLRDGSWLLVDNVNLCSPAVLDRLNALLEPNGVLTIGERGVDKDGRMIEIKPHPEFRLFLTMDPKNGEISRAMRNRGVEIYMLNQDEGSQRSILDVNALIKQQGLLNDACVSSLVKIHDLICEEAIGEKPNLSHMQQAAFLIGQQLLRGVNIYNAYKDVISDVYNSTVDHEIIAGEIKAVTNKISLQATLKTDGLEINSRLAHLQQQATLIEPLKNKFHFVHFFTIASSEDLELREKYLDKILKNEAHKEVIELFCKALRKFKLKSNLPFDMRWLPDTITNCTNNTIFIALYYILQSEFGKIIPESKDKSFTFLRYLQSVQRKEIENKIDDPVIKNIMGLLKIYDVYLHKLQQLNLQINNETAITILSLLQFRFVLFKFLQTRFKDLREIDENTLNKLHIYYKWFVKFSVKNLQNLLGTDNNINVLVSEINSQLPQYYSILTKVGKRYQKNAEKPLPLHNEAQLKIEAFQNEVNKIDIYNPHQKSIGDIVQQPELRLNAINAKLNEDYQLEICVANSDSIDLLHFPFIDYFCLLKLLAEHENAELQNFMTVPVNLIATMLKYKEAGDRRLSHELSIEFQYYIRNCAALNPQNFIGEALSLPLNTAVLTYLISNSILDVKGEKVIATTTLGNYRVKTKLFSHIQTVLWKNLRQISSLDYNILNCERKHLTSSYEIFFNQLASTFNLQQATLEAMQLKIQEFNLPDAQNECKSLIEFLSKLHAQFKRLKSTYKSDDLLNVISNVYILLNYTKALLNSKLPMVDVSSKLAMKRALYLEEIDEFEELHSSFVQQNELYAGHEASLSPLCPNLKARIKDLQSKNEESGNYVAIRPPHLNYGTLVKKISHAFTTLLVPHRILQIYKNINDYVKILLQQQNPKLSKTPVQLIQVTIARVENFTNSLKPYRYLFPDIVAPLLSNITEFVHGLTLKLSLLKKLIQKHENEIDVQQVVMDLIKMPALDKDRSHIDLIHLYLNETFQQFTIKTCEDDREVIRLLKCGLIEVGNLSKMDSKFTQILNGDLFVEFNKILKQFVEAWRKQEESLAAKKQEDESLYKMKTKCDDKSEEELAEEEFTQLFPSYLANDFSDFEEKDLGDTEEPAVISENIGTIRFDDVKFISDHHVKFMLSHTKTEWLNPVVNQDTYKCDFVTPLLYKSRLFKLLVNKFVDCLSCELDEEVIGSLNVLVAIARNYGLTENIDIEESTRAVYNFYKDSNVHEITECYHVLEELRSRIAELLSEWPDHPTLQTIKTVIERIKAFDITSPVPRFLTGFNILLTKCHEWEENAHSGVSLSEHSLKVSSQLVTWRKLEMNYWKHALENCENKLKGTTCKHWFFLYEIMEEYIELKPIDDKELISSLQKFITQSNLVEFQVRLQLLLVFHCHATFLPRSRKRDSFLAILWNLYKHYEQFIPNVSSKIKAVKVPIDKRLKEFILIVKWKDISYWALKDTLQKTHKTIHKFMRECEEALKQPASPLFNNEAVTEELIGVQDRLHRLSPKKYRYQLDSPCYLSKLTLKQNPDIPEADFMSKIDRYYKKSKTICLKLIEASEYPQLIQKLDCFITQVITTSSHLQSLEVTPSLPKEKQVSEVKNHLQQKRRALADLFKALSKIGLSFRKGIVDYKQREDVEEYLTGPIDLAVGLNNIPHCRNDDKLLILWEGVEVYYRKSFMRMEILEEAIKTPSKELGIQNIDRCKGFGAQLMLLAHSQKRKLLETINQFYLLRYYQMILNEFNEHQTFMHIEKYKSLQNIFKNVVFTVKQYKIILASYPEPSELSTDVIELPLLKVQQEERWDNAKDDLNKIMYLSEDTLGALQKVKFMPFIAQEVLYPVFLHVNNFDFIKTNLQTILDRLSNLKEIFMNIPMAKSINYLFDEINNFKFNNEFEKTSSDLKPQVQKIIEKFMLVFQNLFAKYVPGNEEREESELFDNHLNKLLIENINDDLKLLDLAKCVENVKEIIKLLNDSSNQQTFKEAVGDLLPFLDQTVLLHHYFVTQMVSSYRITCKMTSVLLNIFIDLASKGFCIPPEMSDELGGESKTTSGMGLGDGEGEKDVSDRIESEDQLDDAQPAGQEKQKDEDKDCKEEDKGIEMSEDFDSKLQDVEKPEDDEDKESNQDNNSDAEEQMGDVDEGADKLDKELWNSDNEDEGDLDDKKEEKGDKGEQQGEAELSAKQGESQEEDAQGEQKEKQKEINEMDEPELDDEQTDPYHGNQPELPEPEPMDLPDDLQLDDGDDEKEQNEENPFDIDAMKDEMPPIPPKEMELPETTEETKEDESDDEVKADEGKTDEDNVDEDNKEGEETKVENTEVEDKDQELNQEASGLDENQTTESSAQAMDVDNTSSADNVKSDTNNQKSTTEELNQEDNPDKEGVGQSQMEESQTGHKGQANAQQDSQNQRKDDMPKRNRPSELDSEKTLGDASEPVKKKMKTLKATEGEDKEAEHEDTAEIYQHIKEAKETKEQVLDSISREQAENLKDQEVPNLDEEKCEEAKESQQDIFEENEEDVEMSDVNQQKAERLEGEEKKKTKDGGQHPEGDIEEIKESVEVEGDLVETHTVGRSAETTHHTQYNIPDEAINRLSVQDMNEIRSEVERQLSIWNEPPSNPDAEKTWEKISALTSSLAQELSEQLRLVLEPTQASHLKGDYRTGRRINMRKVIPYIASQFRKDKIWLRRTKPSKREYQIVLAIDDSSSMADNHSKELAFESVALISKALTLLESGQLAILSFGEGTEVLHKLTDTFTERSGSKLLQKFQFDQKKTCVAKLVDFATEMLHSAQPKTNSVLAKLLVIVSDGRGIFSEGESYVQQAVRRAKLENVFMIFVIIDNPEASSSILDIRKPVFKEGKVMEIKSYMDAFPFPFYIILRDINALPSVLSDALRQWFEIVSNLD